MNLFFPNFLLCLHSNGDYPVSGGERAGTREDSPSTDSGRGASEVAADKAATSSSDPVDRPH